ncbi:Hexose_transporter [Hexamita inflata]|uniref:Hexose transporter n=1 Tax=Hexamita inflata TaxID=28002 RepID=A0AA86PLT9_9EUKA|nr:Hexose transporter [Hexamita inflata]
MNKTTSHLIILYAFCIFSALNYGSMLTNTPIEMMNYYAERTHFNKDNPTIISFIATAASFGAAFAQVTLEQINKLMSQKKQFYLYIVTTVISNCLTCIAVHYGYLIVMRFLTGWSTGSYFSLIPIFVNNSTTPKQRGVLMTIYNIFINLGLLLGYATNLLIASVGYSHFYVFYIVCAILSTLIGITNYFIQPVSEPQPQTSVEVPIIKEVSNADETKDSTSNLEQKDSNSVPNYTNEDEVYQYTKKQKVRMVVISILLGTVQMTTGITSMLTYASLIFSDVFASSYSGIYGSMIIGATNTLGVVIALPLIQRIKRKTILSIGLFGTVLTNITLSIVFSIMKDGDAKNNVIISIFVLFTLFYQLAPGPVILILCGEIFPKEFKVKFGAVGFGFNWSWNILVVFTYKYFSGVEYIVHALYAAITFVLSAILLFLVPETLNKKQNEINLQIQKW